MTSYNRDYTVSQETTLPPYKRELTPLERETMKRVRAEK
jgi:hypothetical protein